MTTTDLLGVVWESKEGQFSFGLMERVTPGDDERLSGATVAGEFLGGEMARRVLLPIHAGQARKAICYLADALAAAEGCQPTGEFLRTLSLGYIQEAELIAEETQ